MFDNMRSYHMLLFLICLTYGFTLFRTRIPAWKKYVTRKIITINRSPRSAIVYIGVQQNGCLLDQRFLSFSLDTIEMKRHFRCFPLLSRKINILANALSPAYLRIGGTAQDFMTFVNDDVTTKWNNSNIKEQGEKIVSECIPKFESWRKMTPFNISVSYFEDIANFARKNGLHLIFGLNGKSRAKNNAWNERNSLKIIKLASERQYNVDWELGNEPNRYVKFGKKYIVSPSQLVKDIKKLRFYVKNSGICGPGVTQPKTKSIIYFKKFLDGHPDINTATYHQYYMPQKYSTLNRYLDPTYVDKLSKQMKLVRKLLKITNVTSPLWLGESGSSSGGGAQNLSDTFASGFLYLAKLGVASENCHRVVIRQSFYGGYYSMLNPITHDPLPDYWSAVIFKQLIGRKFLYSDNTMKKRLKTYTYCSKQNVNDIVIVAINFMGTPVKLSAAGFEHHQIEKYILTSIDGDLHSKGILLNGKVLELGNDFLIPSIHGKLSTQPVIVPKTSYAFLVVKGVSLETCFTNSS